MDIFTKRNINGFAKLLFAIGFWSFSCLQWPSEQRVAVLKNILVNCISINACFCLF